MNMNERLSQTLALLAVLSVAASTAIGTELGPQLTADQFTPQSAHWHEVIDAFAARYRLWQ